MVSAHWKHLRPTSLRSAVEVCVHHARDRYNRSVEQIADRMGLRSHWVIYKWMESGDIPLRKVLAFQYACGGCTYITDFLAHSTHKLVVAMPTGREPSDNHVLQLQKHLQAAVSLLLQFQERPTRTAADETIDAITTAMQDLAWHRGNVEKAEQPEFDFEAPTPAFLKPQAD